ncbi:hypothetical protein A2738_03860 [Candidatus Nomurabacteria bacterium RIFCSPHIGHO2_01_FULL_42_15]|uniref:Methyltransferase FkbM domain-containing protein n=1 Tax=Candidatus Nomurabacteria bacterium RIFCSPHIGHO2_01_FULL_42_15 TaxID=1801742 RepID=A0A1F6VEE2_9BACT|nr:MAG: hypothetical protein A2738_03860 [Candidatus Nomurabacteria bacterium RIFCSPHIGHO2_01_FULL_42_15]OGI93339.1 MAG: hypothetical protein A3A99_03715 [Candidatus Nomurabacteria bacterium RIFCSPLOWO2_01_FULL_41_18]
MNPRKLYTFLARCYKFGIFWCIKMSTTKLLSRRDEFGIRIPGYKQKMFLRKHTSDEDAFDQIFVAQDYTNPFLDGFSPKVIIDAGAYVGYSSVYFANKYSDAKIIAIEPEDSNFELLQKNTLNYNNIYCIQAALWGEPEKLKVVEGDAGRHWAFKVEKLSGDGNANSRAVSVVTMPQIIATYKLETIDILKIDIEGAEKELFSKNYESWISKCKIIVIELHDRFLPGCSKVFYSALSTLPFNQHTKRENIFVDLR